MDHNQLQQMPGPMCSLDGERKQPHYLVEVAAQPQLNRSASRLHMEDQSFFSHWSLIPSQIAHKSADRTARQ